MKKVDIDIKKESEKNLNLNLNLSKSQRNKSKKSGNQRVPSQINIYGKNMNKNEDNIIDANKPSEMRKIYKQNNMKNNETENQKNINRINLNEKRNIYGNVDKISLNKFFVHCVFCCIRAPKNSEKFDIR